MLHTRALVQRTGGWKPPEEATGPVDYDLLLRFAEAGASFAATGEPTVFKFNAAWRRNAYKSRDAQEQAETLARIKSEGEDFRRSQLMSVLQAVIEERFFGAPGMAPSHPSADLPAHMRTARFKGSRPPDLPTRITEDEIAFYVEEPYLGFEWHVLEADGARKWRWTGPSTRSSFSLPVRVDRPFTLSLEILAQAEEGTLGAAELWADDRRLACSYERQSDRTWLWSAVLDPAEFGNKPASTITIVCDRTKRNFDHGGVDRRWLGLPVGEIRLTPIG
jgi:hypothetical protein